MIYKVFINKNFIFLWSGKMISQLGDKFYSIAMAWWILKQTNSPGIMGLFLLVSVMPSLLFGFFAGVLVDRLNRKNILIITDIIRGVLVLAVVFLSAFNCLRVWQVFVIGAAMSLVSAFFDPAVQAVIPQIVSSESLKKANSMNQMINGVCNVLGPVLGAVAISIFGVTYVFLFNALSFLVSAAFEKMVVIKLLISSETKSNIWKDMKEGAVFIKSKTQIVRVIFVIAVVHFFMGSLMVMLPFLADSLGGSGIQNLGNLQTIMGFGILSGAIYIGKKKGNINELNLIKMLLIIGLSFVLISLGKHLNIQSVYLYMFVFLVIGFGIAAASVYWQSLIQLNSPEKMTGRVFSVATLAANVSLPAAYGAFGILLSYSQIKLLMLLNGICLLIISGAILLAISLKKKELC